MDRSDCGSASVRFTQHLSRFFPGLEQGIDVPGATAAEIVTGLDSKFPGMRSYIVNDNGSLRRHVNIFINNEMITDRERLSDTLRDGDSVYILQALSGG